MVGVREKGIYGEETAASISEQILANAKSAGVIMGAKAPIVLVSRADSAESKLYSIAYGALIAKNIK